MTANEQMYVNKAICESFAAINVQMFERSIKLSNSAKAALYTYIVLQAVLFLIF